MSQPRPNHKEIEAVIEAAERVAKASRATRADLGRRRTPTRAKRLRNAREQCSDAAKPFRPWLGMAAWGGIALDDELAMKKVMEALRYERRQIDKMKL